MKHPPPKYCFLKTVHGVRLYFYLTVLKSGFEISFLVLPQHLWYTPSDIGYSKTSSSLGSLIFTSNQRYLGLSLVAEFNEMQNKPSFSYYQK